MKQLGRFPRRIGIVLCACLLAGSLAADYTFAKSENIYEEIQRFDKVLIEIDRKYVEEVSAGKMIDAAIEGMREVLDPHTAYFQKDDYDELMVHTKAEFGGLGITISIRDNVLTVVSPLPGTPASMMGIQAGDRIVKIEGKSTKGITVEQAVKKLRGKPGTKVTIEIEREGEKEPIEYTITRDVIRIKSVPYVGMISDSVGYIRLISFSKESGREIEEALNRLSSDKLVGVILDLRNNPGGLLPAAIEVAEKLLDEDKLVVYTRGRMRGQNKEYKTDNEAVLGEERALVVLVNEGSASASEIVAGAVQDWDRGVIMGRGTYGKGSVQTVLPLRLGKNNYLKLTTAYYYTPSGRCINKSKNSVQGEIRDEDFPFAPDEDEQDSKEEVDSTAAAGDSGKTEEEVFYTNRKRAVYGGGGIVPDVKLERQKWEPLEEVLERKTLFFKFAIRKLAQLKERGVHVNHDFVVTDAMLFEFHKFVKAEKVEYDTPSEKALKDLQKAIEKQFGDSAIHKAPKQVVAELEALTKRVKAKIEKQKVNDFKRSREYIRRAIKRELLAGSLGEEARFHYVLTYDEQVQKAIELMVQQKRYRQVLSLAD